MNLTGIHHIAIICSNYEKSKDFYTNLMGFPIIREVYREERNSYKLDLSLPDGTQLELFSFPEAPTRPSYPEAQGLRHLAFRTPDIVATVEELERKGVKVEPIRIDEHTNSKFTFFKDPDGLPIELYEN
ncbi:MULTISPECIES: VOC family protein [unclassified Sutcliffiella]|uniref:SMU1112c/YaeR family gloxylase I-like metalloprotein n=1 Tax=unclassified Sutcliffiella TaxID=2837532 RepID=UPI0030D14A00